MSTTPLAYNPGRATISGATNLVDLSIGTGAQEYAANPGGITWWMGPEDTAGYLIARPVPAGNQPTQLGAIGTVRFARSVAKTDQSFLNLANYIKRDLGGAADLETAASALTWLNTQGYWTSWINGVTFSQAFVNATAPTSTVETAWNTFRAALTGTYTQFIWSSTNGSSITVSDATKVQTLANNLRTATAGNVTIGANTWFVGIGCGTPKIGGVAVEFSNVGSCTASSTYALRPMINNQNWGGTNQSTVNAPTQTITLTFS
jgi:hypothetical protein